MEIDSGDLVIDARDEAESSEQPLQEQAVAETTEEVVNPEDLPPELQEHFKRMQASHTRKMQALSERERKLEGVDIDELKQSQRQLNRILTDPEFRGQLFNGITSGQTESSGEPQGTYKPYYYKDEINVEDQEKNLFKELAYQVVVEQVLPIAQQLSQRQQAVERSMAQDHWSSVVQENPNAKKHLDEVSDMLQKVPGLGDYFAGKGMSQKDIFKKLVDFAAPREEPRAATPSSNGSPPRKEVAQEDRQRAQLTHDGVSPSGIAAREKAGSMFDRNNLLEILRAARGG